MRLSQVLTKTRKNPPADEVSRNAQLLIQAGYIHKEMAGAYAYLPLGMKVLDNIVEIIREEMNDVGGQELHLTALQQQEVWEQTGRWSDEVMDVWFKTELKNGTELGLAPTHEEPLTKLMKNHISSYRDLPLYPYQFQTKFRNELRAKSGIMRGREFLMKDLYSFSRDQQEHDEFYERMKQAYRKVFDRMGLGDRTYLTFASGGSFSKFSHEFQTLSEAGEDTIYLDRNKEIAVNNEIYSKEILADLELKEGELEKVKAVEVGNIFSLGTKFSDAYGLTFNDDEGKEQTVVMGSYGIGPGRVMGTIVEVFADEDGLIWPQAVAPAQVHLLVLGESNQVQKQAEATYGKLRDENIETIFDDRDESAGTKFADADMLGVPIRVVVSEKTLNKQTLEVKPRDSDRSDYMDFRQLVKSVEQANQ